MCPRKQTTEPKLLILVSFFSGEVTSCTDTSYSIHILWEVSRFVFFWATLYNAILYWHHTIFKELRVKTPTASLTSYNFTWLQINNNESCFVNLITSLNIFSMVGGGGRRVVVIIVGGSISMDIKKPH